MTDNQYTVSDVARLAHVSVRALHHYDDIGLLTPARRSTAGYRLYDEADLRRLHEILLFRELGVPLDGIQRLLDAPDAERANALRQHRAQLDERLRQAHAVIRAVDAAIDALERGTTMDRERVFDGFGDFDHAQYTEAAEQRWGDTDAYRESHKRTKHYSRDDWTKIKDESEAVMTSFAELLGAGAKPTDTAVLEVAERHRQHITRWFYPCDYTMHAGLADLFVADSRFGEYFEKRGDGLTGFVAAAIRANADRR
jgi:DNA-binding transcriptional MerR regulator